MAQLIPVSADRRKMSAHLSAFTYLVISCYVRKREMREEEEDQRERERERERESACRTKARLSGIFGIRRYEFGELAVESCVRAFVHWYGIGNDWQDITKVSEDVPLFGKSKSNAAQREPKHSDDNNVR
jgi:hypothetical protein